MLSVSKRGAVRVLAWIEAATVTGPAKNLLEFGRMAGRVELVVSTFRRRGAPGDDPFQRAVRESGLELHVIEESGPWDGRTLGAMRELVKRVEPGIVQTHGNKSHLLARVSGVAGRRPWVAFHHGYTKPTRKQEIYNLADRFTLKRANLLVTVTRAFEREMLGVGVAPERIRIVPNAVDCARFAGVWQPRERGREAVVVSIGRLSKEKAQVDLVEAVGQLGRPCRLVLAGDGPEREALREAAARRGVKLELVGQLEDIRPVIASGDLFVLPSHSEGSPNALLEAMAAGIPSVATAVGGVPETMTDEREGLVVPPGEPGKLAAAMGRLIDDAAWAAQLGAAARRRVEREFSPEARTERLTALYESVL